LERYGGAAGGGGSGGAGADARRRKACCWINDDTGVAKKERHSVGVARQFCGRLGKTDNCQVAVSLSLATDEGSVPLDYRLYLPQEWTDDPQRCAQASVPATVGFATSRRWR
jgi:SRSO17 transposase